MFLTFFSRNQTHSAAYLPPPVVQLCSSCHKVDMFFSPHTFPSWNTNSQNPLVAHNVVVISLTNTWFPLHVQLMSNMCSMHSIYLEFVLDFCSQNHRSYLQAGILWQCPSPQHFHSQSVQFQKLTFNYLFVCLFFLLPWIEMFIGNFSSFSTSLII